MTSPPYWGLRDYGTPGQIGLEPTPEQYVERMVEVFREVRRVLAPHGTVWLNLGDSYVSDPGKGGSGPGAKQGAHVEYGRERMAQVRDGKAVHGDVLRPFAVDGLRPKNLVGIPWRVAFALQADGWYLRSDIIWSKPNPMPESVTDRPTKAHEYVFLLSKQERYFFDQEAVREPAEWNRWGDQTSPKYQDRPGIKGHSIAPKTLEELDLEKRRAAGRNMRDVWSIPTQPYPEAHFATFPEELARRCIAAGCPESVCRVCGKARERVVSSTYDNEGRTTNGPRSLEQRHETAGFPVRKVKITSTEGFTDCGHADYRPGIVLDPFIGSGTVAYVARKLGRHAVGIEISEKYARELIARRLAQQSLFA